MAKQALIDLVYQDYINYLPVSPQSLHAQACSSDDITVKSWRQIWEKNIKKNHATYKSFSENGIGKLYGFTHQKPVLIAGAGPSLKSNIQDLKDKKDITLISCLHNFHFMEDNEIEVDFYVTLDAGEVTIEEVTEGGKKSEEEYWAMTAKRTLLAYIGSSPNLLAKWQGKIIFFNCPVPNSEFMAFVDSVEVFNSYVSTGGNVLGASFYIAKAIFGASIIGFLGADFCFSYDKKFHPFDSKYDANLGNVLKARDVFGLPVLTWQSYYNFKGWFEYVCSTVPGIYYNCSEGGTLGAYEQGNIRSILQIPLKDFIRQMTMFEEIQEQMINPQTKDKKLLF